MDHSGSIMLLFAAVILALCALRNVYVLLFSSKPKIVSKILNEKRENKSRNIAAANKARSEYLNIKEEKAAMIIEFRGEESVADTSQLADTVYSDSQKPASKEEEKIAI